MSSMYIFEKMDQWIEEDNDRFRQHLGMSGIGDDDERKSWLNFRWSLPSPFKGRMLRLFDTGQSHRRSNGRFHNQEWGH